MLWFAHRGLHVDAPENSMGAFAAAAGAGFGGVETDVRRTAAGEHVLFHDRALPDGTPIAETTRTEMNRTLGFDVPFLDEALDALPDLLWNLEIKAADAAEATMAAILARPDTRFLVTSFDHPLIASLSEQETRAEFGFLISHRPVDVTRFVASDVESVVWYLETMDAELMAELEGAGKKNLVYGAKTAADHEHCRAYPLTGVITDRASPG